MKKDERAALVTEDFKKRQDGRTMKVTLQKPQTLWNHSDERLYCKTGTVLRFDNCIWGLCNSDRTKFLDELVEVQYDIPGAKVHSKHTTGTFISTVHRIYNLAYEEREDKH